MVRQEGETVKKTSEYQRFDRTMRQLIAVPHSEIKATLDAEKAAKTDKRKARKNMGKK
jgi:hypothetical protein